MPAWLEDKRRAVHHAAMKRHRAALGLFAALGCFGAGIAAAQLFSAAPPPAPNLGSPPAVPLDAGGLPAEAWLDAGGKAPKILFDPDAIELLPDASLKLTLPPGFDGGDR
jgi:hypothetical protein